VFAPWPEPVDTVMVGGRIVVEGGRLLTADVPALVEQANEAAVTLLAGASRRTRKDYFAAR
jgi:hypothetical protein